MDESNPAVDMSAEPVKRKLATLRLVRETMPIEGADLIELAIVDGWQCIVKKGSVRPGQIALYFEIDSWLPANDPRFGFLEKQFRKNAAGEAGARLRTIKMRGQLSQGLLLPVDDFPECKLATDNDVTELLGITKWEPPMPACLGGVARGNFPGFIPKTDQERVQNVAHYLTDAGVYEVTVKLDGSSMTVFNYNGQYGVCSRNLDLVETESNTFWKVAKQYGLPGALAKFGNFAIQGELIGEGIQGNPEGITGHDFYVFDVWDIDRQKYLTPLARRTMTDTLGLKHVQIIADGVIPPRTVEAALDMAEGPSLSPNRQREGIVFKRIDGLRSFKAISNSYLLNRGE